MKMGKPTNTGSLPPPLEGAGGGLSFTPSFGGGRGEASSFYDKVYKLVRLIPAGKVTSYGAIAAYLGSAQSSRMVGWAMNNAGAQLPYVPAHRVVNRNGLLTGKHHFGTPTAMQEFLEAEGIEVIENQIIDFEKHFWDPMVELEME